MIIIIWIPAFAGMTNSGLSRTDCGESTAHFVKLTTQSKMKHAVKKLIPALIFTSIILFQFIGCDYYNIVEPRLFDEDDVQLEIDNEVEDTLGVYFSIPEPAEVKVYILDNGGKIVVKMVDGWLNPGQHDAYVNISGYEDGIYCLTISVKNSMSDFREVRWFKIT